MRDVGLALSLVQGTDLYRILMTDTEVFMAAGTQQLCLRVYRRFPGGNVVTENFEGLAGKGAPSKTNSMCGWSLALGQLPTSKCSHCQSLGGV